MYFTHYSLWSCDCVSTLSSAACTMVSLSASRADVASSSRRILGLRTRALAMAILCFCPPLSWVPLSPTSVSNFCLNSGSVSVGSCHVALVVNKDKNRDTSDLRKVHDEVVRVSLLGGLFNLLLRHVESSVSDVLRNSGGKEDGLLTYHSNHLPQVADVEGANVVAVN